MVVVTSVDVHEIADIGYKEWCEYPMRHVNGSGSASITTRCAAPHSTAPPPVLLSCCGRLPRYIYIVQTDTGVEGIGEYHALEPQETIDQYVGTNPFDCAPPLPLLLPGAPGVMDAG